VQREQVVEKGVTVENCMWTNASHRFGCSSSAAAAPLPRAQLLSKPGASHTTVGPSPWPTLLWLRLCQPRAQLVWHGSPQAEELAEEQGRNTSTGDTVTCHQDRCYWVL